MRYLFRELPEACDNTLWIAERAELDITFGEALLPDFPIPAGFTDDTRLPRPPDVGRRPAALGRRAARHGVVDRVAYELKVINDMGFASYFLITWDLIKLRPRLRHPGRAGPRVGGRVRGRLLPADHRPRPDQVRPAVRALPQPEPDLDARHRHGLRLPLPRPDDPLRRRAVRPRPRRPDHHVRHDQGAQRRARRSPRARLPVRRRRQDRQGDAAARDGSRHAAQVLLRAERQVRRRLQGGVRAAGDVRQRHRRQDASSTSPRGSRDSSAPTASTPRRW